MVVGSNPCRGYFPISCIDAGRVKVETRSAGEFVPHCKSSSTPNYQESTDEARTCWLSLGGEWGARSANLKLVPRKYCRQTMQGLTARFWTQASSGVQRTPVSKVWLSALALSACNTFLEPILNLQIWPPHSPPRWGSPSRTCLFFRPKLLYLLTF